MHDPQHMETTLWNYIDGATGPDERQRVEELLRTDAQWQTCYAGLLDTHRLMQEDISLNQPSLRFTQNVMEEIARLQVMPAVKKYINPYVIRGIGAFFLVPIAGLLVFALTQANWSGAATAGVPVPDLSRFNWSRLFNSAYTNILMMINIVLALMLLDMYLSGKRREKPATEG